MSIQMDIHEILEHLPHRYPFLLIDRVVEFGPGSRVVWVRYPRPCRWTCVRRIVAGST